jgi:branched-chain amino acid transport system substrate-binding protein
MKKRLRIGAVLLGLALVATACGGDDSSDTTSAPDTTTTTAAPATTTTTEPATTTTEPPPTTDGVLKIGYVLPQTGALAVIADALIKPLEMGVEEITAAGGQIELLPGDSGTDPAVAGVTVDQHLNADVDAIIGPASSNVALSVIDKITGSQVPMCSPSNTGAIFTTYDDDGYYFRTAPPDNLQGEALAEVITEDNRTSVAIVYRNEEYGVGLKNALATFLEDSGVTVAAEIAYAIDATSFDAEVAGVIAAGVDAAVLITFGEGVQLTQAMIEAGVGPADIAIYGADGYRDNVNPGLVDPDNPAVMEGVKVMAPSVAPPGGEPTFAERFTAFAPGAPTVFSAHTFDCLISLVLASEVAGTDDPTAIQAALNDVTRGGTKCATYAECSALVAAGDDIDYDGASGALDFVDAGEPAVGVYDLFEFDAAGDSTVIAEKIIG